jgi:hypothetical protein
MAPSTAALGVVTRHGRAEAWDAEHRTSRRARQVRGGQLPGCAAATLCRRYPRDGEEHSQTRPYELEATNPVRERGAPGAGRAAAVATRLSVRRTHGLQEGWGAPQAGFRFAAASLPRSRTTS